MFFLSTLHRGRRAFILLSCSRRQKQPLLAGSVARQISLNHRLPNHVFFLSTLHRARRAFLLLSCSRRQKQPLLARWVPSQISPIHRSPNHIFSSVPYILLEEPLFCFLAQKQPLVARWVPMRLPNGKEENPRNMGLISLSGHFFQYNDPK